MRSALPGTAALLLAASLAAGAPAATPAAEPAPADSTEGLETFQAARIPGIRGRPDLLQHASLAFAIGVGAGVLSDEPAVAGGVSISFGVAKELWDPRVDRSDLVADFVGAALAAAVTWWVSR